MDQTVARPRVTDSDSDRAWGRIQTVARPWVKDSDSEVQSV
jgi:hypothetical protein